MPPERSRTKSPQLGRRAIPPMPTKKAPTPRSPPSRLSRPLVTSRSLAAAREEEQTRPIRIADRFVETMRAPAVEQHHVRIERRMRQRGEHLDHELRILRGQLFKDGTQWRRLVDVDAPARRADQFARHPKEFDRHAAGSITRCSPLRDAS